jgi:SAM-dependent methyltransferase
MEGKEVNRLQKLENRAEEDEDKGEVYSSLKLNVMSVALHNIECSHLPSEPEDGDKHDWIPFPCGSFVDMCLDAFFALGQDRNKKFLDIGCGIGTKVMLADVLFDSYGFDINKDYTRLARQIGCKNVWYQDAMTFEGYGEYDLLYFYRPFKDNVLEDRLETNVYQQMKEGSFIAPMHTAIDWSELPGMKQQSRWIYQKIGG